MVRSCRSIRFFALIPALALLAAWSGASRAEVRALRDSTHLESWTLPNGLMVVTRDLAAAKGVAITLAFRDGFDQDPAGREGWNHLLAEVYFLSPAEEFPARSPEGLDSSRPMGWNIEVGPSYTRFTEVAELRQFAGVLHEVAARLRAAQPDAATLDRARKAVLQRLATDFRGQISSALYYEVRTLGTPDGQSRIDRYASGQGITKAALAEIAAALKTSYVPAGAVLSLAGNLEQSGIDVRRVVANEFGVIAAGSPPKAPVRFTPHSGYRYRIREDLASPEGVIGLRAPAISDTSHPSFFMNSLVIGTLLAARWGRDPQTPSPFRYALLDEPELMRIYAPITHADMDSSVIREGYEETLLACKQATFSYEEFQRLHDGVLWLIGGPLTHELIRRAATDPGVLATLSTTAAMRALRGGDAFWADYERRFEAIGRPEFGRWYDYYVDPHHKSELVYTPSSLLKQ